MKARRLVVIGNGMAGARTVEEIVARGGPELFHITVFGDEPYGNYNRIMLSGMLSGEHDERDIILNDVDWYTERNIRLHTGTRISRIDRPARQVRSADGARFPYDVLIIATGSRSFLPPIDGLRAADGNPRPGVFGFRTVRDTREMMRAARQHQRAVVIGGGLLGLEAARGLQAQGLRVELMHAADWLMNQQLDEPAGALLRQRIEELGIAVHCAARTEGILGRTRVRGVRLSGGEQIACDMVVVAAGIRPNSELAVQSGLTVDRAIVVDDQLRTLDDNIYAVGECAQHRGQVYGLVAPLWEQAKVLAAHLTGGDSRYTGSRNATKLKVAGVDVATMGLRAPERAGDEHVVFSEPLRGVHKSVVIRDDRVVGATLLGDVNRAAYLMQALDRGLPLPRDRARLLFDLDAAPAESNVADLDDEAPVCNCNAVNKGTLVRTVRDGRRTVDAVMNQTRAGKGCGSCKSLVKQIVEWAAGEPEEDASVSWYVPAVPLARPDLVAAIRGQELRSVPAVCTALAVQSTVDAVSARGLDSLLRTIWGADYVGDPGPAERTAAAPLRADLGLPAVPGRSVQTCVGREFCQLGLGDSTSLGMEIEDRFTAFQAPAELRFAVAGCSRNCSEAYVKDVGVVGVDGGWWEIYVGGAAGEQVRKGDLLATVETHDRVLTLIGRFLQYYKENANWLERTHAFVSRVGADTIREVVVEDSDGIADRLDAALTEESG